MKLPALICLFLPLAARGTLVTTASDEDNGSLGGGTGVSLREAVKYSPAGTTITFAPALSGLTIRLTLGEITIAQSLTIDGSALPQEITLSGDKTGNGKTSDDTRILNITTGTILLDSLILSRGNMATGSDRYGGAIHVSSASVGLTLRNVTLADNEATTSGGGIYFLGALNNPASFLTLQHCIVSGNKVGHDGGGIRVFGTLRVENTRFSANSSDDGCAIYFRDGSATVEDSTFSDNVTGFGLSGGGIFSYGNLIVRRSTFRGNSSRRGGGIYQFKNTLTVEDSTFTGNSASLEGGAIYLAGDSASIRNSTLSGNSAGQHGGGIHASTGLSLLHATVVANSAGTGGGIVSQNGFILNNSIVTGNSGYVPADISGSFSGSNNIAVQLPAPPPNPLLVPLGDHGGPTQTMPPLPASPAIGAAAVNKAIITDQRGYPRDSTPDIGAVEFQGNADIARVWTVDPDGDGSPFGAEQALGTNPSVADPANPRNLSAPLFTEPGGDLSVRFGIGAAAPGTRWILTRSPDLSSGSFLEIYRFDGTTDTAVPGINLLRTASDITVTDTNPPPGGGFYRFEALFDSSP